MTCVEKIQELILQEQGKSNFIIFEDEYDKLVGTLSFVDAIIKQLKRDESIEDFYVEADFESNQVTVGLITLAISFYGNIRDAFRNISDRISHWSVELVNEDLIKINLSYPIAYRRTNEQR